ncbi:MAG TPA: hypothetical protein VIA18_05255 [Polyangia bacterium]|nr:hypothetical protein [Polyangia bacterium]
MRMRADEVITLTRAEYEALRKQAQTQGESFNAEEMQAIREQYEERVARADERREELEWKLRLELAKIRDAESSARRSADEMQRVERSLVRILEESEGRSAAPQDAAPATQARPVATIEQPAALKPVLAPVLPQRQASPPPPPIPKAATAPRAAAAGSHADKFRQAMAARKRYLA